MSLVGTVGESQMTLYPMQSDSFGFCQNNNSCAVGMDDMFNAKPRNYRVSYEEGLNNIARYIESFESESKELWLVFKNEGLSLSKLIYTAEDTKLFTTEETDGKMRNVQVLRPSSWWHWLRMTQDGQMGMKNLIRQLVCVYFLFSLFFFPFISAIHVSCKHIGLNASCATDMFCILLIY